MKVKEESEKVGLKLSSQQTKIIASSPITSWEIDGETVETVRDLLFCPAERLLWPGRASPSASQLLAFSPGQEQAAGVWET